MCDSDISLNLFLKKTIIEQTSEKFNFEAPETIPIFDLWKLKLIVYLIDSPNYLQLIKNVKN